MPILLGFIFCAILAQATPATSPSASPAATATPSVKHTLSLDIPPGWHRTESGRYNQWTNAEGSNFRLTVMPPMAELQGPHAVDTITALFVKTAASASANAKPDVNKVQICNGTESAYRVDHLLGADSPAFMMLIPGTVSTGLINYEILPGQKADPAMLQTIDKICWP